MYAIRSYYAGEPLMNMSKIFVPVAALAAVAIYSSAFMVNQWVV